MKMRITKISAIVLFAFGALTLFLSTSIILDLFGIRAKEGNYVPFVVWANFLASILYLIAAFGFLKSRKSTVQFLALASAILFIAFIALLIHINSGGTYETKTVAAMIFRTSITLVFTAIAHYKIAKLKIF